MASETRKDTAWKKALGELFPEMMSFFIPEAARVIDFSHPAEHLEQELLRVNPDAETSNRYVDKLLKVKCKDGQHAAILVHIEQQGYGDQAYEDRDFSQRMFTYRCYLWLEHRLPVVGVALLTDKNPNYRPDQYVQEILGSKICYRFNSFKLLDWNTPEKQQELEASSNPFALVILASIEGMKTHNDSERFTIRERLIDLFAAKNSPSDINYHKRLDGLDFFWEVMLGTSRELEDRIAQKLLPMYREGNVMDSQIPRYQSTAGKMFLAEMKERLRPEFEAEFQTRLAAERAAREAAERVAREAAERVAREATLKAYRDLYIGGRLSRLDTETVLRVHLSQEEVTKILTSWDKELKESKTEPPNL